MSEHESDFARRVTALLLAGQGDRLPVSALPVDGTFPPGTARLEKRSLATQIPLWNPALCTECGLCALVCPHAAIRAKAYPPESLVEPPATFASRASTADGLEGLRLTIQVAPDDCTGCGVCVDICPACSKEIAKQKAIQLAPKDEHLERERVHFDYFLSLPDLERTRVRRDTPLGSQLLQPLFEFSSACPGCGETPYLKLLSQLFGDRALIGNATGCSSIYGGHLPTTPWTTDGAGRGPAWANSLFEDTAEFGLGLSLALNQKRQLAARLLRDLTPQVGSDLAHELLQAPQETEAELAAQRRRVGELSERLSRLTTPEALRLRALADVFVRSSVWIVGGDGWAYDIGFGGLDHVLASGQDVNVLVLDTGLYSSTGGQVSKSTPRAAVAKFAGTGKNQKRKDLGRMAMTYEHVYVAQVALGADPQQTIRAFSGSRRVPRTLADSGLQSLRGAGRQHDDRPGPPATGRAMWPVAALPLRSAANRHGGEGSAVGLRATPHTVQGLCHDGSPFRSAGARQPGPRTPTVRSGPTGPAARMAGIVPAGRRDGRNEIARCTRRLRGWFRTAAAEGASRSSNGWEATHTGARA